MTNKQIVAFVIQEFEGGPTFTNDPDDAGAETKFGISIHGFINEYLGRRATPADIAGLTVEKAIEIGLWALKHWRIHLLDDWRVRFVTFDWCFNGGADDGIPTLQRAVLAHVDGKLGPVTATLANTMDPRIVVMRSIADRQKTHVRRSANGRRCDECRTPSQRKYLGGWVNRCSRLLEETSR